MDNKENKAFLKKLFLKHCKALPSKELKLTNQFYSEELAKVLEDVLEATDFYGKENK